MNNNFTKMNNEELEMVAGGTPGGGTITPEERDRSIVHFPYQRGF